MSKDTTLANLREQMQQIVKANPAPAFNAIDRDIALFEDDLREAEIVTNASIAFGELNSELNDFLFNADHQFYGRDYQLCWQRHSENGVWTLLVLNTKSSGKRRLLDCPNVMKEQLSPYLDVFARKMANLIKSELE